MRLTPRAKKKPTNQAFNTYDESRIDFLQYLLLDQHQRFAFALFNAFLFQLLARVHFARRPHLARAHLAETAFAQYPIHAECFIRNWLAINGQKKHE